MLHYVPLYSITFRYHLISSWFSSPYLISFYVISSHLVLSLLMYTHIYIHIAHIPTIGTSDLLVVSMFQRESLFLRFPGSGSWWFAQARTSYRATTVACWDGIPIWTIKHITTSCIPLGLELLLISYPWKMCGYPQFSFGIPIALAKICFSHIVINSTKIPLYYKAPSLNSVFNPSDWKSSVAFPLILHPNQPAVASFCYVLRRRRAGGAEVLHRVCTLFKKQISRTFPGLIKIFFQDS